MEPLLSVSSTLYCDSGADEVASSGASGAWTPPPSSSFPPRFCDAHYPVSDLLSAELQHAPRPGYLARLRDGSLDPASRRDAIDWILKVQAFYRFRPTTGFLAVNYLDRFLSSQELPKGVSWPWQLLAVACLSVAAKMEETDAPQLLDLQVLEPRFVFHPRTVGRMELLLMAALRWRMRPVTPFDFVGHFAGLLRPGGQQQSPGQFSRVSELILGTQRLVEFLGYRPSAIAAATVLCVAGDGGDYDLSRFYDVVSEDAVGGCRRLMESSLRDACRSSGLTKSAPAGSDPPVAPQSPVGVLDAAACASCDTQISAAEPPTKRRRLPASSCTESTGSSSVGGDDLV